MMKLLTFGGDYHAFAPLIAAEYNGVKIETLELKQGVDNKTDEFLAKSPFGEVPVLDTDKGSIFGSNAIARFIARFRRDTELCGVTFFESAQVDSWIDFCNTHMKVPTNFWVYPLIGQMDIDEELMNKGKEELIKALDVLDKYLQYRTFLVGNKISLADIVLVSTLCLPFKLAIDKKMRKYINNVTRWFLTCVNQPEFKAVVGEVKLCDKPVVVGKPAAKKPAAKKEKAPEKAPEPTAAPKKQKNPLDLLPPSSMDLDAWKRAYSNSKTETGDEVVYDYYKSMDYFWEHFDAEGYSLWFCEYNYNSDNRVGFMTSNLVTGFIQRSDAVRKYSFGSMVILGEEGQPPFKICGAWMMRGPDMGPLLESNPDAEYYTWTKMDLADEAQKKMLADRWCAMEKIGEEKIFDSKVFK